MTAYKGRELTAALVAMFAADGLHVGEGKQPEGVGWQGAAGESSYVPFVVVHPTPGGVFDGSLGVPFDDGRPDYVISSYGATQQQCQDVADRVFGLMVGTYPTVAGRVIQLVMPDVEGGVVIDDDAQPAVFYSPTRWRIYTTTA